MNVTNLMMALLAASLLVVGGCKKNPPPPKQTVGDVTIDLQKVYDLNRGTSPEVQAADTQLQLNIRYSKYVDALADLDKIVNDPSLNPTQKKEAEELIGQLKILAQKPPGQ